MFKRRFKEIFIILGEILILCIAAFKLNKETELNAFVISKEVIQIFLFKFFAILIEEDIIERKKNIGEKSRWKCLSRSEKER